MILRFRWVINILSWPMPLWKRPECIKTRIGRIVTIFNIIEKHNILNNIEFNDNYWSSHWNVNTHYYSEAYTVYWKHQSQYCTSYKRRQCESGRSAVAIVGVSFHLSSGMLVSWTHSVSCPAAQKSTVSTTSISLDWRGHDAKYLKLWQTIIYYRPMHFQFQHVILV